MRRALVAVLAVLVLSFGAACESGSGTSSGNSSSGSSAGDSNGTSANGSSADGATSDGGTSGNDGSSNNGGSSGGSSGGSGSTATTVLGGGSTGTAPPGASAPPPPAGFTLPEPDSNGNVRVPERPPKEVRDEPPRRRLSQLPPVPRSCLDDDLTLLDVFAPYVSVPVRLMYCLVYVGTIARLPRDINITVNTPSLDGPDIQVGLLAPNQSQRAAATLALIILLVVVALLIGYTLGRRKTVRE